MPGTKKLSVNANIDRVQVLASPRAKELLPRFRGFALEADTFIRNQQSAITYSRVRRYRSLTDEARITLHYGPRAPWLAAWKFTIFPDDEAGLQLAGLNSIIDHCRIFRFILIEFAFDFDGGGVDRRFIQGHGEFGKSRRRPASGNGVIHYGTRKGAKFVRCYRKESIGKFRVEVELHSSLLRKIDTVGDLISLPCLIFPKHFRFVSIDWARVNHYLQDRYSYKSSERILKRAKHRRKSIARVRRYLGRSGIRNIHRFVKPTKENDKILVAMTEWRRRFRSEYEKSKA